MIIKTKRIYEPFSETDGYRILIDRLWPRGIKKELAHVDLWMKEIAPSTTLRKWFDHDPEKWTAFIKKYQNELKESTAFDELINMTKKHTVITLLYAAKDEVHNHAVALKQFILNHST